MFNIDFEHLPIDASGKHASKEAAKGAQEAAIEGALRDAGAELIVLARYMQVGARHRRPNCAHRCREDAVCLWCVRGHSGATQAALAGLRPSGDKRGAAAAP